MADTAGVQLDLSLVFKNEQGNTVKLSEYADGGKPVILVFVYYGCPNLCTLTLNSLVEGLQKSRNYPGDHFRIVTVSLDPRETPGLALEKKKKYLSQLNHPISDDGWVFLTGTESDIKALTKQAGFKFIFDAESQEFMHAAGLYFLSPAGVIKKIINGSHYDPEDLDLALAEAGDTGSLRDKVLLYFYRFKVWNKHD